MFKIAYKNVQHYRHTVHRYLDAIWLMSSKKRTARKSLYNWLGLQMGLAEEETHVSLFTRDQCRQAIQILRPKYIQLYGQDLEYKKKEKVPVNDIRITDSIYFNITHILDCNDDGEACLHGHNYKLEVTFKGPQLEGIGHVIRSSQLNDMFKAILPDNRFVFDKDDWLGNEIALSLNKKNIKSQLYSFIPTSANLLNHIIELMTEYITTDLALTDIKITEAKLWENDNKCIIWRR